MGSRGCWQNTTGSLPSIPQVGKQLGQSLRWGSLRMNRTREWTERWAEIAPTACKICLRCTELTPCSLLRIHTGYEMLSWKSDRKRNFQQFLKKTKKTINQWWQELLHLALQPPLRPASHSYHPPGPPHHTALRDRWIAWVLLWFRVWLGSQSKISWSIRRAHSADWRIVGEVTASLTV